jgi:uncharacterized protein YciI
MFIVLITYTKLLDEIDEHLAEHRAFLDIGYKNNYFVVSGPQNPRTGGVIISQLTNRAQLENILKKDPFLEHNIANYQIIEFEPVKYHPGFSEFILNFSR